MDDVTFECTGAGRYYAYKPKPAKKGTNAEYAKRVIYIGTIERHADRWFWWLRDDTGAGMTETLDEAMEIVRGHA